jgi:hypothetical protein
MSCEVKRDSEGQIAKIICGKGPRRRCHVCGAASTKLCDYSLGGGKSCDREMCWKHARIMALGIDYCTEHAEVR